MLTSLLITLSGGAFAWGLSQGTLTVNGWPVIAVCAALCFVVQWVAFIPAYLKQTEHFYDLTGSTTYLTCVFIALSAVGLERPRALLLTILVIAWALRLGLFLFKRVKRDGGDGRFDELKPRFGAFLIAWTLQGLWVLITSAAAWVGILSERPLPLGWPAFIGLALWLLGFSFEVIADQQKRAWRAEQGSQGFIHRGLWRYSRHPNYFGEITLWAGVSLIALPVMEGWLYLGLLSPLFVYLLLTKISGIPLLEARAQRRWGDDPSYQRYLKQTSRLIPRPPRL